MHYLIEIIDIKGFLLYDNTYISSVIGAENEESINSSCFILIHYWY